MKGMKKVLVFAAMMITAFAMSVSVQAASSKASQAKKAYRKFLSTNAAKYVEQSQGRNSNLRFALVDINYDGTPELYVDVKGKAMSYFAYINGKVVKIGTNTYSRCTARYPKSRVLKYSISGARGCSYKMYLRFNGKNRMTELVKITYPNGRTGYTYATSGVPSTRRNISKNTYYNILNSYNLKGAKGFPTIVKNTSSNRSRYCA